MSIIEPPSFTEEFEKEVGTVSSKLDCYSDRDFMVILDFYSSIKTCSPLAIDRAIVQELEVRYKALFECMKDN